MNEEKLPTEPETIQELMKKIENLEKEKNEYFESLKRAKGDVLKIQREFEEKFEAMKEIANFDLIYHLLSVLDSFELAFQKQKEIDQGFYLIYSQLKDILEKYGLEEIETENKKFDPNFHEAIISKKCEKENCQGDDEGLIVETLSKGYLYKGRVLRPARVKIINH
ncbi:MAG: protein GrpE [Candidatus Parcubacteria bacterium]|nr:MAG: protein GrpE [Candidatus Parcubacteria bacterium]